MPRETVRCGWSWSTANQLRVAVRVDADALMPLLRFDDTEKFCNRRICETLLVYEIGSGLGLGLAGSLMWDPGHAGAILELNPDARWSDGRSAIARDVVFPLQHEQQRFPAFYAVAIRLTASRLSTSTRYTSPSTVLRWTRRVFLEPS